MKHLIKSIKGTPVVSTDVIAIEFGRRHDNVMQNIRSLIDSEHLGVLLHQQTEQSSSAVGLDNVYKNGILSM